MSDTVSNEITIKAAEIYNQEMAQGAAARFFGLDLIPGKKLSNALGGYAAMVEKDEYVLYLYDATDLGSAKDGFLLTNKRLFFKNFLQGAFFIEIGKILDIIHKPSILSPSIAVRTEPEGGMISITLSTLTGEKDGKKLVNVLNKTIAFLKNSSTASTGNTDQTLAQAQSGRAVVCKGCGANYVTGSKICDYCGAPL